MVNYVIMIEESRRKKQRKRKGKEIEIGRTEEKIKVLQTADSRDEERRLANEIQSGGKDKSEAQKRGKDERLKDRRRR